MNYFYEPVNLTQWNMFEKVTRPCHVEPFLATKSMELGDIVFLHVGAQDRSKEPGIYAVGVVVKEPYIYEGNPDDWCYGRLSADVMIVSMTRGAPYVPHEVAKEFINQFRSVHKLDPYRGEKLLGITDAKLGIQDV